MRKKLRLLKKNSSTSNIFRKNSQIKNLKKLYIFDKFGFPLVPFPVSTDSFNPPLLAAKDKALGFNKLNGVKEHELTPQIEGMLRKVEHLVKVEGR